MFLSDTDSESNTDSAITIYNPKELNSMLLNLTTDISYTIPEISVCGDITNFKKWKRSGCSFKISINGDSIECKCWTRPNKKVGDISSSYNDLTPGDIEKFLNTRCTVTGNIRAEYFYSHKFVLDINTITHTNNKTKLNELKTICQTKKYFENKKTINWTNIKSIGIISKQNTQGYDDLRNQFKFDSIVNITLEEITLEGPKTSRECIKAIKNLQNMDIIIITRGGGDTSEISNSYDTIELFDCIKLSNVPIITAIGHEQDKGDKLLITNVSDNDFSTPTTLAKDLNHKFYEHIDYISNEILQLYDKWFYTKIDQDINTLYDTLYSLIEDILTHKLGAKIIKLTKEESNIIIELDGKYYKNTIHYQDECDISDDISTRNDIINALDTRNINTVDELFKLIQFSGTDSRGKNQLDHITRKYTRIQTIIQEITKFTFDKTSYEGDNYRVGYTGDYTLSGIDAHLQLHNTQRTKKHYYHNLPQVYEMKGYILWYKHILLEHYDSIITSPNERLIPTIYNCINTIYK